MGLLTAVAEPIQYPSARRDESVVDDYHGVMISDPYRWLEDPDSEETREFVEKQVELTDSVLKTCETREKLHKQLTKMFDFPKYDTPFRAGDKFFYFHNTGLQPQKVLYIQDSLVGKPEILLDPNTLSEDGTVALSMCAVSEDAKYLAYGISSSGSDWVTIKVMRIEDKSVEPDTVSWVKFSSISWTHDGKGFFYSRYPALKDGAKLDAGTETSVNLHHELYYHFLGTDQSEDILCWNDPNNPQDTRTASVTEDGKYVLLYTFENCDPVNKIYYCDLSALSSGLEGYKRKKELLPFVKLVDNFEASYDHVANDDSVFTFRTNKNAPKYKLVRVDLNDPSSWTDVLDEHEKDVLESAVAVNENQMVVNYLSDVKNVLQLRDLKAGTLLHLLPIEIGTVASISGQRKDKIVFIGFTSFLIPGIIYTCNLDAEVPDLRIFQEIFVPGFDRTEFKVNQVFLFIYTYIYAVEDM
ncbi:Prolyl oligopeptidase family protein [Abeliophyllum distichum]|uniref:Prolyl oligopeptidase family protein n=1 Tax=Abeliophyllum distichum TaxID=126358 RepID=A0ABD1SHR2_9LAMI